MKQSHELIIATVSALIASTTSQITGTYPIRLVGPGTPDHLDGANRTNYPSCATACDSEPGFRCPVPDPLCSCGAENRGNSSACEAVTCSDADYLKTESLAQACGPFYEADPILSSSVSAAIASGTAAALSAVKTRKADDLSTWPLCAQTCVPPILGPVGGCNGLADRNCTCHCDRFIPPLAECETKTCSKQDLEIIGYLSDQLCAPVGGQYFRSSEYCGAVNGTGPTATASSSMVTGKPTTPVSPPIPSFTGAGAVVRVGGAAVVLAIVVELGGICVWGL